jgi:glycine betaine catabolism B
MALKLFEKEFLIDNIWAFRFEPEDPMTWIAGQYMSVELPHDNPDGKGTKRWFTVSSAPYEEFFQITTRVTDSSFKQALSNLPIGGELQLLDTPHGDFIWHDTGRPLVFVAAGIGITPFRSILRQRAHERASLNAQLVYINRTNHIVFKDELDSYATADPALRVEYLVGESLTASRLAGLVPALNDSLVYISGPTPMVTTLGKELKAAGLPADQIKQDFYPSYTDQNY